MKASRRLITLMVLLTPLLIPAWFVQREFRQEQMNRALITAIKHNDTQSVLRLLEQGANANTRDVGETKIDVWQALRNLFANRQKDNVKAEPGIPALMVRMNWDTDLSVMAPERIPPENPAIIKALLEHGADPTATALDGKVGFRMPSDALMCAAFWHYPTTLRLLLEHGADPTRGACAGQAVYYSAINGNVDMLRCLFAHGAPINDSVHASALEAAINSEQLEAVRFLLSQGADVNIKGDRGHEFLETAIVNEDPELVRLLKQHGARK